MDRPRIRIRIKESMWDKCVSTSISRVFAALEDVIRSGDEGCTTASLCLVASRRWDVALSEAREGKASSE